MEDNFNALTEARLEKLEERVHSVEVILFMTISGLLISIVNLLKSRKKQ